MPLTFARTALAACSALLLALPAQAQWKWRDAQGHMQYSDRPPPHSVAPKDVLKRPSTTSAPPVAAASAALPASAASAAAAPVDAQLEARKRQLEAGEQAQRRAEEEKNAKTRHDNCERAREYARTLESGMRIGRVNAQGEREILDDAQRTKEQAKARETMGTECRP